MEILDLKDLLENTITEISETNQVKRQKFDSIPFLFLVLKNETVSLLRNMTINKININKLYYRLYRLHSHTGVHHVTQFCQIKQLVRNIPPYDDQICIPIKLIPQYVIDGIQVVHIPCGHTELIIPTYTEFYNPYDIADVIQTTVEVDKQLLTDYVSNSHSSTLVDLLLQATSTSNRVVSKEISSANNPDIDYNVTDGTEGEIPKFSAKMLALQRPTVLKNIAPPLKAAVEYNCETPYMINLTNHSLFCNGIIWINKVHWQQTICHIVCPSPTALEEMISNITLNISFQRLYACFLKNLIMSERGNINPITKRILPNTDENFFHFPIIHTNDLSYRAQTFQNLITSLWKNFTINYELPKLSPIHDQKKIQEIHTTYCKYAYHMNCLLPEIHTVSPLWYHLLKHRYKFEKFIFLIYQLHNLDIAYLDIIESEHIPFIIWKNDYNITFYLRNHYSLVDLEDVRQKLRQNYIYYQQIKSQIDRLNADPNKTRNGQVILKLQKQLTDLIGNLDILVVGYIKRQEILFKHPFENTSDFHVIRIPDISTKEADQIENILHFSTDATQNIELLYSRLI